VKRVLPVLIVLSLFSACAGERFVFEYDGEPVVACRVPDGVAKTRVEARAVTRWEIHGYEPDARLILGTALSTVAGVVVTPVWCLKRLFTGWGDPEGEEAMRQRLYDSHLRSWLFMGYLWAPVDFEVLDRSRVYRNTGNSLDREVPEGAYVAALDGQRRRVETLAYGNLYRPVVTDTLLDSRSLYATAPFDDDLPALYKASRSVPADSRNWLFSMGIEAYDRTSSITYSRRSAELFTRVAMKRLGVPAENVFLLNDDGKTEIAELKGRVFPATAASIKDELRFLMRDVAQGDRIYVYYSGHGLPSLKDGGAPYLLARDQVPDFIHTAPFFRVDAFYQALAQSRAAEIVVFMDSCFTGAADGVSVFGNGRAATRLVPKVIGFDEDRMAVITAGTDRQFSNMYPEKGHRLFSYFLMKELLNDHDSLESLYQHVFKQTRRVSRSRGGTQLQEPTARGNLKMALPQR